MRRVEDMLERAAPLIIKVLALVAAGGAVWRTLDARAAARIDETTLMYLGVAAALLLLKDVKSLAFGSTKIEFERRMQEIENKVEDAQSAALGSGHRDARKVGLGFAPGAERDDPWKGVFGRQAVSGARELRADVSSLGNGHYRIRLMVRSTNPKREPLAGYVQFYLHPTFRNDRPFVTVGPSGQAELTLTAWGAFTVGAVADGGRTLLELDLAELASAPADFRAR